MGSQLMVKSAAGQFDYTAITEKTKEAIAIISKLRK